MSDEDQVASQDDEVSSLRSRNALLEAALRDAQETARRRAISAELKSEALRRGIVDIDGLRLIDSTELTMNEDGDVQGVAATLAKLQRDKPWLFSSNSSSSLAVPPPSSPTRNRLATEMSLEEWRAARQDLLRRR